MPTVKAGQHSGSVVQLAAKIAKTCVFHVSCAKNLTILQF